ncbi:hypothetical protein [Halosimplex marinum]|uniref:hypothetical protein n=1 Tax=Halosimplex marinum TaxID=3396620 RepID=UPI003F57A778
MGRTFTALRDRRREDTDTNDGTAPEGPDVAGRVRRGIEGGALATLVMTVYRLPVTRSLPPSAEFWTTFVAGGRPQDHPLAALVLHFAYGIGAGGVFGALVSGRASLDRERMRSFLDDSVSGPPERSGEVTVTMAGLLYGVALSVVGERLVLGRLLRTEPDDRFAFHVGHVLYGITLGAWVGTRTRREKGE